MLKLLGCFTASAADEHQHAFFSSSTLQNDSLEKKSVCNLFFLCFYAARSCQSTTRVGVDSVYNNYNMIHKFTLRSIDNPAQISGERGDNTAACTTTKPHYHLLACASEMVLLGSLVPHNAGHRCLHDTRDSLMATR